jgi:hypothetical protein
MTHAPLPPAPAAPAALLEAPAPAAVIVPPQLRSCPMPPPPPPLPRTIEAIADWAGKVETARRDCAWIHKRLVDRLEGRS